MKKPLLIATSVLLILFNLQAQHSTKGFSFQGYAIDADDRAIASTNISVKFTVYGTAGATTKTYVEEHASLTTDPYGIFSATVGEGAKDNGASNASFEELNFNNFDFKLKVDVKETSGGVYATISDKTLNAVPYARSAANGVPVGTVVAFAGPAAQVPDGWLLCDGTAYDASANLDYAQLFVAIGTVWGGTGAASFNVPDFRGQFLRGLNTTASGYDPNRALGNFQAGDIQSHGHSGSSLSTDGAHTHDYVNPQNSTNPSRVVGGNPDAAGRAAEYPAGFATTASGAHTHTVTIANTGGTETRPHNKAVNYIIKY